MSDTQAALDWARNHKDDHLAELKEVLSIPSVSTPNTNPISSAVRTGSSPSSNALTSPP